MELGFHRVFCLDNGVHDSVCVNNLLCIVETLGMAVTLE